MFFIILSQDYGMLRVHSDCSDCFAGGKQRIKEIRAPSTAIRVWIKRQCKRYNIATPFRDHFLPGRVLVVTHLACCLYIFFSSIYYFLWLISFIR